jgi:hypothetical protein
MAFPSYTFDAALQRYRSKSTGRLVSTAAIRRSLEVALDNEARRARSLAEQLRNREISLLEWQVQMRSTVKNVQLFSAALAKGGWAQLDQSDFGRVGQRVRFHYEKLDGFVQDIEAGIPFDGRYLNRAELYAKAATPTYHAVRETALADKGFDQVRSILHPAEHCEDCIREEAKGWQPIGEMLPIGDRECMVNDQCSVRYRNSVTGEEVAA